MTWTLWVVYFGMAMPPREFGVYHDQQRCDYLAQKVVRPTMESKGITMAAICLPTQGK
jgi:hypothetical protein